MVQSSLIHSVWYWIKQTLPLFSTFKFQVIPYTSIATLAISTPSVVSISTVMTTTSLSVRMETDNLCTFTPTTRQVCVDCLYTVGIMIWETIFIRALRHTWVQGEKYVLCNVQLILAVYWRLRASHFLVNWISGYLKFRITRVVFTNGVK